MWTNTYYIFIMSFSCIWFSTFNILMIHFLLTHHPLNASVGSGTQIDAFFPPGTHTRSDITGRWLRGSPEKKKNKTGVSLFTSSLFTPSLSIIFIWYVCYNHLWMGTQILWEHHNWIITKEQVSYNCWQSTIPTTWETSWLFPSTLPPNPVTVALKTW